MHDERTYQMHRVAQEGEVFYENALTRPEWVRTFFPKTTGQTEAQYLESPKIAFPITGDVVNRIASLLHTGMEVDVDSPAVQLIYDEMLLRNGGSEVYRDLLVKSLATGNCLAVINTGYEGVTFQTWPGKFVFRDVEGGIEYIGYMYKLDKQGRACPITAAPTASEIADGKIVAVMFGPTYTERGGMFAEHYYGFSPAVLFRSIDKDEDGRYGEPFHLRYRDSNIEYNHVASQVSKSIKVLQNVWKTNQSTPDPDQPLRLNPDTVNYLGPDGMLEQATRELSLAPEFEFMSRLKNHISASAQVPDFMTGLSDVGKVESGLALQIVSGPLTELMGRLRESFKHSLKQLLERAIDVEYRLRGQLAPPFELNISMSESVLPADKERELDMLIRARDAGFITSEQAAPMVLNLFGIEDNGQTPKRPADREADRESAANSDQRARVAESR